MSRQMLAVSSLNHRQRSGGNLADGLAIPGSGLLLMTWQNPTLGFWKQEWQLRTGLYGGCLRSIAQRTRSGARSYWIGYLSVVFSVCLSVGLSVTFVHCAQTAEDINTISSVYDSTMSLPYRFKIWITSLRHYDPFPQILPQSALSVNSSVGDIQ